MKPILLKASFKLTVSYDVFFTRALFESSNDFFLNWFKTQAPTPKLFIVLDSGVLESRPNFDQQIEQYFRSLGHLEITSTVIAGGESCKSDSKVLEALLQKFHDAQLCRHSIVFAIGGGALLDLVGYASAICHRGLRHVRVPTTVLSQNDSGVGVKNGVNAFGKKNFLGTFAPPEAVICDFSFLESLSPLNRQSGYAEAIKVALLKDLTFYEWIRTNSDQLFLGENACLEILVQRCAALHVDHIQNSGDPFEKGNSRPLDFGHWSAHKLEQMSDYKLSHGQAVALGLCCDLHYARFMGWLGADTALDIIQTIQSVGLPIHHILFEQSDNILKGLDEFQEHLGGMLTLASLRDIEEPFDLHEVDIDTMKKAFQCMIPK